MAPEEADKSKDLEARLKEVEERLKDEEVRLREVESRLKEEDERLKDEERRLKEEDERLTATSERLWQLRTNIRAGFRRVTLVLAVVAAVYCAILACTMIVDKHRSEQLSMRWSEVNKEQGQIVGGRIWAKLSKEGLVVVCILGGLAGAAVGYLAVNLASKLIKCVVFGFGTDKSRKIQDIKGEDEKILTPG